MTRRRPALSSVLAFSLAALYATAPARAHHSFAAEFDANAPITVHGVITQVRLENPHSWFFLDATDPSGKVEKWSFEASTPTSLIRSGVKPGFIKAGDEVTIKGYHARDPSQNVGAGRELVTADGRSFAIGPMVGPAR
jgi:chitodextrinase